MHRVFAVLKSALLSQAVVMTALLATSGLLAVEAHAQSQSRADESAALSAGVRTALLRTGGGKVLSAERINGGAIGMSRIKVVDQSGRMQVVIIEDSPRLMRHNSPFEPEEGRRGRFSRGEPVLPTVSRSGRKLRSGDVEN